jgi:hypothetical protein
VVEQNQTDAADYEHGGERTKVVDRDTGDSMSKTTGPMIFVFPGVDEEAVEAAEGREDQCNGQQRETQVGTLGNCGDEGCSSEAETYGDLLRHSTSNLLLSRKAAC